MYTYKLYSFPDIPSDVKDKANSYSLHIPLIPWLEAIYKSKIDHNSIYILSIFYQDKLVHVYPLIHQKKESLISIYDILSAMGKLNKLNLIKRLLSVILPNEVLCCYVPHTYYNQLEYSKRDKNTIHFLKKAMITIAKSKNISLVSFMHLLREDMAYLRSLSWSSIHEPPNTNLPINFNSFDDYLLSLSSNTRHNVRRQIRVDQKKGISYKIIDSISPDLALELLNNVYSKHSFYAGKIRLNRDFIAFIMNKIKNKKVIVAEYDNKIIAFSLFYENKGEIYNDLCGFNYDLLGDSFVVFNTTITEQIRFAIASKHKSIYFGPSNYYPKLVRGFMSINQYSLMKNTSFVRNMLLRLYSFFLNSVYFIAYRFFLDKVEKI
jgi:hypothetical protein